MKFPNLEGVAIDHGEPGGLMACNPEHLSRDAEMDTYVDDQGHTMRQLLAKLDRYADVMGTVDRHADKDYDCFQRCLRPRLSARRRRYWLRQAIRAGHRCVQAENLFNAKAYP